MYVLPKFENTTLPMYLKASQATFPVIFSLFYLRVNYCSCSSDFYLQVKLHTF